MAMRRTILFGLGVFLLFSTPQAYGEEREEGRLARYGRLKYVYDGEVKYGRSYYEPKSAVRGKRGRKYARRFSFEANLTGDKLAIFKEYGFTPHRLGYNVAGQHFERWKYHSMGMEFVFKGFDLVDTRRFMPENNHID
jgi:hypothetical protein